MINVYCRNNPITYFDPDGSLEARLMVWDKQVTKTNQIPNNPILKRGATRPRIKSIAGDIIEEDGNFRINFIVDAEIKVWYHKSREGHEWAHANDFFRAFSGYGYICHRTESRR